MQGLEFAFEFSLQTVQAVHLAAEVVNGFPQLDEISLGGTAGALGLFGVNKQLLLLRLKKRIAFLAVQVLLTKRNFIFKQSIEKTIPQFVALSLLILNLELKFANLVLVLPDGLLSIGVGLVRMIQSNFKLLNVLFFQIPYYFSCPNNVR